MNFVRNTVANIWVLKQQWKLITFPLWFTDLVWQEARPNTWGRKRSWNLTSRSPRSSRSLDGHRGPTAKFMNFASLLKIIGREAVWKSVIFFFSLTQSLILVSGNVFGDSKSKNLLHEWNLVFVFSLPWSLCPDLWSFFDGVNFTFPKSCFEMRIF